jgi:hypothetical protein
MRYLMAALLLDPSYAAAVGLDEQRMDRACHRQCLTYALSIAEAYAYGRSAWSLFAHSIKASRFSSAQSYRW